MQMLRPEEVEMLVCGNPELDMDALRKVTVYDGYTKNDPVIRLVNYKGLKMRLLSHIKVTSLYEQIMRSEKPTHYTNFLLE